MTTYSTAEKWRMRKSRKEGLRYRKAAAGVSRKNDSTPPSPLVANGEQSPESLATASSTPSKRFQSSPTTPTYSDDDGIIRTRASSVSMLEKWRPTLWHPVSRRLSCRIEGSKLSLGKANQTEIDYRGRPLHDSCHRDCRSSLLSHDNHQMDLKGFFTLLQIVVVVQNLNLIMANLRQYGILLTFVVSPLAIGRELFGFFGGIILVHLPLVCSYEFQKRFPIKKTESFLYFNVIILICSSTLLVPYEWIVIFPTSPLINLCLVLFSITWFLKLWSFHHVCTDTRYALLHEDDLEEVCGTVEEGEVAKTFPTNLEKWEYYSYFWMPTVCYQVVFPRVERIHWMHLARQTVELIICLLLMKVTTEQYISPIARNTFTSQEIRHRSVWRVFYHLSERILKISIPTLLTWILMFFAVFHHWCNVLGELTRFGDRCFYLDWWNSRSIGQYWRKWNLPIHNFCRRHVQKPLLRMGVSKVAAALVVFTISALFHEYMAVVPLGFSWTGLVFWAFMAQIPLIIITEFDWFDKHSFWGNVIFWVSFCFTGQPIGVLFFCYLWGVRDGSVKPLNITNSVEMQMIQKFQADATESLLKLQADATEMLNRLAESNGFHFFPSQMDTLKALQKQLFNVTASFTLT